MNWVKFLKITPKSFRGVISRDQIRSIRSDLIDRGSKNLYYIVNLNDSTQPGSHWVVINVKPNIIEYFDSFGLNAPHEVVELSHTLGLNYIYNSTQYQDLNSVLCGYWCLYFVNESQKGRSYYDILKPFSHTDTQFNERMIVDYFQSL